MMRAKRRRMQQERRPLLGEPPCYLRVVNVLANYKPKITDLGLKNTPRYPPAEHPNLNAVRLDAIGAVVRPFRPRIKEERTGKERIVLGFQNRPRREPRFDAGCKRLEQMQIKLKTVRHAFVQPLAGRNLLPRGELVKRIAMFCVRIKHPEQH